MFDSSEFREPSLPGPYQNRLCQTKPCFQMASRIKKWIRCLTFVSCPPVKISGQRFVNVICIDSSLFWTCHTIHQRKRPQRLGWTSYLRHFLPAAVQFTKLLIRIVFEKYILLPITQSADLGSSVDSHDVNYSISARGVPVCCDHVRTQDLGHRSIKTPWE